MLRRTSHVMIAIGLLLLATTAGAESIQFDMGGQEAGVDQGPVMDLGPAVDQGPKEDQGVVADQGPKLDKGATADAGADGGSKPSDDDGCSMSGRHASGLGLLPLLALMLIPIVRRRR